jgi:hypothetical protein
MARSASLSARCLPLSLFHFFNHSSWSLQSFQLQSVSSSNWKSAKSFRQQSASLFGNNLPVFSAAICMSFQMAIYQSFQQVLSIFATSQRVNEVTLGFKRGK